MCKRGKEIETGWGGLRDIMYREKKTEGRENEDECVCVYVVCCLRTLFTTEGSHLH
jgi:hypothetical protein